MAGKHEIKSEKILVKDIFSKFWFRVPEYQRPYIWGRDEIDDLLDDLMYAHNEKADQEYFLGSFVFQSKKAGSSFGQEFDENDLLDGQQRLTTLMMLFACIRDLSPNKDVKKACQESVFQEGNPITNVPERIRIVFAIRDTAQDFVERFIKPSGGTDDLTGLEEARHSSDRSVRNMADAVLHIREYLNNPERQIPLDSFVGFILNKVLMIYVSTEDLDDAFRLFTILNDRGVPLRNSDILKSLNLGALTNDIEKAKYAKLWEEAEGELGDDFDRFLNHIRTILLKDKARLSLLDEFEYKIYNPREKEKATGKKKPPLLSKGKETFQLVERYLQHYNQLFDGNNYDQTGGSYRFDNLIKVMRVGLPSTDWQPPLLRYFDKFRYERLLDFLIKLDNQFSSDWISQYTPTERIERMNNLIRIIESADNAETVLSDNQGFQFDKDGFNRAIEGDVYGRRFARYLLLKLDYIYADHSNKISIEHLSVEHILPQNPKADSQWCIDFSEDERNEWVNKLGNLVLITTRKNSAQSNRDFVDKKKNYFEKRITTCPNSLRIMRNYSRWTPKELKENHMIVLEELRKHYKTH